MFYLAKLSITISIIATVFYSYNLKSYAETSNINGNALNAQSEQVEHWELPVKINTTPIGARIEIDNKDYGESPQVIVLEEGLYNVKITLENYKAINEVIEIKNDGKSFGLYEYNLEKEYKVTFDSEPQGANIYLDRNLIGLTPIKLSLVAGEYNVKYSLNGYKTIAKSITINDGDFGSYKFKLPKEIEKLLIQLDTEPSGLQVKIDGTNMGSTPLENIEVLEGEHDIEIGLKDKLVVSESIEINRNVKNYSYKLWEEIIRIGDTAIDFLINILNNQEIECYIRSKTAQVLGEIGNPRAIHTLSNNKADECIDVRYNVIGALDQINKQSISTLKKNVETDSNEKIRRSQKDIKELSRNKEYADKVIKSDLKVSDINYSLFKILTNKICNGETLNVIDIDFDERNYMYILDPVGCCIRVFEADGNFLKTLCDGELTNPTELLIKGEKIHIIYEKTFVARYDLHGNLEVKYKGLKVSGKNNDILGEPVNFAVGNQNELYVIDRKGPCIAVFGEDGRFLRKFGNSKTKTKKLIKPIAIDVDDKGNIYVCDSKKQAIFVYNSKMEFHKIIKLEKSRHRIRDMYFDKDNKLFYLINGKEIIIVDFDEKIKKFGDLKNPHKISIDNTGNIYVTNVVFKNNLINKRKNYISKFSHIKSGLYSYYGKFGSGAFLKDINNIAVALSNSIYLSNDQSGEIINVDKNGWELKRFGGKNGKDFKIRNPMSIVTSNGGKYIYVLDKVEKLLLPSKEKVFKFSNSGKFLEIVVNDKGKKIKKPVSIDSDKDGNLYVLDTMANTCFVYNNGQIVDQIKTSFSEKEHSKNFIKEKMDTISGIDFFFKTPKVASTPSGQTLYIFDSEQKEINKYDKEMNSYKIKDFNIDLQSNWKSILKVNNNNGLIIVAAHKSNIKAKYDDVQFIDSNGNIEFTLSGKNSFGRVQDIEIDDTENLYVLNVSGNVYIFKPVSKLKENYLVR